MQQIVSYYLQQDSFSFDVESSEENREHAHINRVTWISLATYGHACVIPMGHQVGELNGKTIERRQYKTGAKVGQYYNKKVDAFTPPPQQLSRTVVFEILKPLFASTTIRKIGHDVIFDVVSIAKYLGFVPPPPYACTKTGFWLLDENRWTRGLKEMTEEIYGFKYDFEDVGKCVEAHPFSRVAYYSFCDSKVTFLHWQRIWQQLQDQNLIPIFNLEMDVLNVLIGMKLEGAPVDEAKLVELRATLSERQIKQEVEVYAQAKKKFNIGSPKQLQELLFLPKEQGGQGLRAHKLTPGGKTAWKEGKPETIYHYSTDDEALAFYPHNELVQAIREYRDTSKVLSTYVNSYLGTDDTPSLIFDGRLHASFQQYGTVTGRFSGRAPNLQNIPRSLTELGKLVRSVFIAPEGRLLVCADFSQIELVVLAHYIGEGKLYEGFLQGIDPHTMTAAMVLGKKPFIGDGGITKDERQWLGKTLNFAIVFGAGINKVASMINGDVKDAKRVLKEHEKQFPEIHEFKAWVVEGAMKRKPDCYITTLLGRKRRVPELGYHYTREENWKLERAKRQIFNSLIQGGAADINKLALVRLDAMLPEEAAIHLTVHDEIVCSAPPHLISTVMETVREAMTGRGIQKYVNVPLKIEMESGSNWGSIK